MILTFVQNEWLAADIQNAILNKFEDYICSILFRCCYYFFLSGCEKSRVLYKKICIGRDFFKKIFILPEKSSVHDGTLSKYTGLSVTL